VSVEPTVASRTVFRGRVCTLRIDDVRMPSGRIQRREIVEHPGAAAVVPVTDGGEVVLVKQHRKAIEAVLLEIPAGVLEPGETALACAHRELAEETGLAAEVMTPLLTFVPSPGLLTEEISIFVARGLRPTRQDVQAAGARRRPEPPWCAVAWFETTPRGSRRGRSHGPSRHT
jgi:ADP-ribose pyrophosphatase